MLGRSLLFWVAKQRQLISANMRLFLCVVAAVGVFGAAVALVFAPAGPVNRWYGHYILDQRQEDVYRRLFEQDRQARWKRAHRDPEYRREFDWLLNDKVREETWDDQTEYGKKVMIKLWEQQGRFDHMH